MMGFLLRVRVRVRVRVKVPSYACAGSMATLTHTHLPFSVRARLLTRVYKTYTLYTIRIRVAIHLNFITILQVEA